MTSVLSSKLQSWSLRVQDDAVKGRTHKALYHLYFHSSGSCLNQGSHLAVGDNYCGRTRHSRPVYSSTLDDGTDPSDSEDDDKHEGESSKEETGAVNNGFRDDLERIVGTDDSTFSGVDLATLIRNKYGRSYDVQLIKKEFMGKNLLALNVMWKYMEQRSFPLTEEEYILRLDDVANTLKCWGAVSHIRSSLSKSKERPRMGKAVSIFIDMDESGGRANEWIYK
ncbi:hypothetical protein IFM89_007749 [Coptis chinensis]|uniref:Uncharacterized protein n=1 Tax=Coptis chinensis TaxID=261450 RepID=A0A835IUX1_9MAGN|nr:hypothetical protein IFM89_007749 [Coptis chinensis]